MSWTAHGDLAAATARDPAAGGSLQGFHAAADRVRGADLDDVAASNPAEDRRLREQAAEMGIRCQPPVVVLTDGLRRAARAS